MLLSPSFLLAGEKLGLSRATREEGIPEALAAGLVLKLLGNRNYFLVLAYARYYTGYVA